MATGYSHTKFRANRSSGSKDMLADRQTDGLTTIRRTFTEWNNKIRLSFMFADSTCFLMVIRHVLSSLIHCQLNTGKHHHAIHCALE